MIFTKLCNYGHSVLFKWLYFNTVKIFHKVTKYTTHTHTKKGSSSGAWRHSRSTGVTHLFPTWHLPLWPTLRRQEFLPWWLRSLQIERQIRHRVPAETELITKWEKWGNEKKHTVACWSPKVSDVRNTGDWLGIVPEKYSSIPVLHGSSRCRMPFFK